MRKAIIFLTAVAAVMALASACAGGAQPPTPTPTVRLEPTPTSTPAPMPTTPPSPTAAAPAADPVALGKSLSARNGCAACHSSDGSASIGPTWKGLFGKEEALADGSTVKVDEAYLRESIVEPDAKIVKGFTAGIMPKGFGGKLSDGDIQSIVAYIKSLQ